MLPRRKQPAPSANCRWTAAKKQTLKKWSLCKSGSKRLSNLKQLAPVHPVIEPRVSLHLRWPRGCTRRPRWRPETWCSLVDLWLLLHRRRPDPSTNRYSIGVRSAALLGRWPNRQPWRSGILVDACLRVDWQMWLHDQRSLVFMNCFASSKSGKCLGQALGGRMKGADPVAQTVAHKRLGNAFVRLL